MFDELDSVLMVTAMHGSVTMAAMSVVLPVSWRMSGMMASAMFLMHAIMMGMMAVMVSGAVAAMGAGAGMHTF